MAGVIMDDDIETKFTVELIRKLPSVLNKSTNISVIPFNLVRDYDKFLHLYDIDLDNLLRGDNGQIQFTLTIVGSIIGIGMRYSTDSNLPLPDFAPKEFSRYLFPDDASKQKAAWKFLKQLPLSERRRFCKLFNIGYNMPKIEHRIPYLLDLKYIVNAIFYTHH